MQKCIRFFPKPRGFVPLLREPSLPNAWAGQPQLDQGFSSVHFEDEE